MDDSYHFEGFIVYQLKDATVSEGDLYNQDKARIVMQCDLNNGHGKLVNYEFDAVVGAAVPKVKVDGSDQGVIKSFKLTSDNFATGNATLVNFKTYYYMAVSYAFNEYVPYKADQAPSSLTDVAPNFYGQKLPFLRGRRNIKKYSAIPHLPNVEAMGTVAQSWYGNGPKITRVEGQGNGGNILDFTDQTLLNILSSPTNRVIEPTYLNSAGPIKIKVVDPLIVPKGNFTVKLLGGINNTTNVPTANNYYPINYKQLGISGILRDTTAWVMTFVPAAGVTYNGATTFTHLNLLRLVQNKLFLK